MKVLIIGDSCKDIFTYGHCPRLCPDAPAPIFIPSYVKKTGGMALNVYENLKSLKIKCDIITNPHTISKTRYVDDVTNHLLLRVDSNQDNISRVSNLSSIDFNQYEVVIVSDYNKGFLTYEDLEFIFNSHPYVFIDTKKIINNSFKNAFYIKINHIEYNNHLEVGKNLEEFSEKIIITQGSKGAQFNSVTYPVKKVEIKDTSGAGDTFLVGLVSNYITTKDIDQAIKFGNKCASVVVQHKGVNIIGNLINVD
jgi:bifunctional ADP-heptose synthase (sugar kinase/adenylyltransferase)